MAGRVKIERFNGVSAANTAQTVTGLQQGVSHRLDHITVKYSSAVSLTVTITLKSGISSAYDIVLSSIALSSNTTILYVPDQEFIMRYDDYLTVLAPSGGGGVTSAVTISEEIFY